MDISILHILALVLAAGCIWGFTWARRRVRESSSNCAQHRSDTVALFATLNPAPVLRFNDQGKILMANPAAVEILDLPSKQPTCLYQAIPTARSIDLVECINHGEIFTCCEQLGQHYYQFTFRGIPEKSFGHIYGNDITDFMNAEIKLIEKEQFLRQVIDTDPNLIFVKDRNGKFTLVNKAVARIYGTTVEDLVGKTDADFNDASDQVKHFNSDDLEVIETGKSKHIAEEPITDSEGCLHWLETIKTPLRVSGSNENLVLGVASDITERKMLQQQLAQAQKMEAVGQLAGGIAHDFNNLLTGILGHTSLMKVQFESNREVYRSAEFIEDTAEKASQLTQKLLGFARKGKHRNTPIDIHTAVRDTLSLLGRTLEKNITLTQALKATHYHTQGDPVQIQQLLLNLALNARDAMTSESGGTPGGELALSTENIEISEGKIRKPELAELAPGRYVLVRVEDTGCGIPPAHISKIFEPFFTTKESGKGTGMGLAMVYGIVTNHGGTIVAHSVEGEGSRFEVYLPALNSESPRSALRLPKRAQTGIGTVLLVDDHRVIREVTSRMLNSLGYSVVTANDGVEAVEFYTENYNDVDLVILDMIMPRMGAKECFRRIREINPKVRAVLSTGYVNNHVVQEILNEGMIGFVQKPYQITKLSAVVAEALTDHPLSQVQNG